jgi:hypothetical protein
MSGNITKRILTKRILTKRILTKRILTECIITKRILTQCILTLNVYYTKTYTNIPGFLSLLLLIFRLYHRRQIPNFINRIVIKYMAGLKLLGYVRLRVRLDLGFG